MPFGEFRRRFDILAASQFRNSGPVLDEKKVSGVDFFFWDHIYCLLQIIISTSVQVRDLGF